MSTQSNPYERLVDQLSAVHIRETVAGVETTIKPIPDSSKQGDLDPRVLANTSQPAPADEAPAPFDLAAVRASMGWPNRDVTTRHVRSRRNRSRFQALKETSRPGSIGPSQTSRYRSSCSSMAAASSVGHSIRSRTRAKRSLRKRTRSSFRSTIGSRRSIRSRLACMIVSERSNGCTTRLMRSGCCETISRSRAIAPEGIWRPAAVYSIVPNRRA